jgi:hypothetical protein
MQSQKSEHGHYRQEGRIEADALEDIPFKKFNNASLQTAAGTINAKMFPERTALLMRFKPVN